VNEDKISIHGSWTIVSQIIEEELSDFDVTIYDL
jgi:hypothetical protein